MSSFKLSLLAFGAVMLLGGCGFTPVYATPDSASRPAMQAQLEQAFQPAVR